MESFGLKINERIEYIMNFKKMAALAATLMLFASAMYSCTDKENDTTNNGTQPGAEENISMPEGENKNEEIIINENYADSELYDFIGTIDEIYDDGSILVYSPEFRIDFDYKVIVEFDENTVTDNFEISENQLVKFEVYSSVKKSEPLTVVAAKLTLLNEVSTQREEEAERLAKIEEAVKNIELYGTPTPSEAETQNEQ